MKIVLRLERRVKLTLRQMRRQTKDKGLAERCQIVLLVAKGRRRADVARAWGVRSLGSTGSSPASATSV